MIAPFPSQYQSPESHKKEEEPEEPEEAEEHVYEVEPSSKQEELYLNPDQDEQYQAAGNISANPF